MSNAKDLPKFDESPELEKWDKAQPVAVRDQGCFVAIIQWDGSGGHRHWVLVHKNEVEDFIAQVRAVAAGE